MSSPVRKFALTTHITVSVGWLGALAAFLALDLTVSFSQDIELVRAALIGRGIIGWYVILPLAFASLATGIVMALGTQWGLFRHYWVLISFILTVVAILVLLTQVEHFTLTAGATAASQVTTSSGHGMLGGTLLHSGGGLVVLLIITALNVYKPKGMTPYGWRKHRERP